MKTEFLYISYTYKDTMLNVKNFEKMALYNRIFTKKNPLQECQKNIYSIVI